MYPIPAMIGTKTWLSRNAVPPHAVTWVWRFPADQVYTLGFDRGVWMLSRGDAEAIDVMVDATPEVWARFLTTPRGSREVGNEIRLGGTPRAIRVFVKAFRGELRARRMDA